MVKENKPIKHHLTDKQKKQIKLDYIETQNLRETARRNKVSAPTVKLIIKDDDKILQNITQKQEENTKDILEYMDKKREDTQRVLDKLLHGIEVKADELDFLTDIKGLATAYGIILDKQIKLIELSKNRQDTPVSTITIVNNLQRDDEE